MAPKPTTASGYRPEQVQLVKATSLYVATRLGDLLEEVTVVGGLVPSLLIPQDDTPSERERHVGTLDLDMGLSLGLLDGSRHHELAERLRRAGFRPDVNENGRPTRQRWRFEDEKKAATVDFLIAPTPEVNEPGKLLNLEADLAAIITPGLPLAFKTRKRVRLDGHTILGERATRELGVCGPGAYMVLKALAFGYRGENKDAYDLYYVLRNYGAGVPDVVQDLRPLLAEPEVIQALTLLERDFSQHDGPGPHRAALFLTGESDDSIQADVVGFVAQFLDLCRAGPG